MLNRIQTIAARAIMYLLPIGGLLFLISALVWYGWNHLLHPNSSFPEITFLESFGIVAIGYVGYSAVAFAWDETAIQENWLFPQKNESPLSPPSQTSKEDSFCKVPRHAEQLSPEEKIILREKIARCCGDVCKAEESEHTSKQEKDFVLTR
ncbi:MAG: hypothetical protein HYZ54_11420 [Ignavibacteriae bacterium]|nr:hypothetical protein [Ignavibacteriota bacterium]